MTCFALRFIDSLRKRKTIQSIIPTAAEMKSSFYRLMEAIQISHLSGEISKLQKSLTLPSNIQKLTPSIHTYTEEP